MAETQDQNGPAIGIAWDSTMVVWWHANQVGITFHTPATENVIQSLHLDRLNGFLNEYHFNLKSFTEDDVPHPVTPPTPPPYEKEGPIESAIGGVEKAVVGAVLDIVEKIDQFEDMHDEKDEEREADDPLNSPTGKYVFQQPSGEGSLVLSFFHVESTEQQATGSVARMGPTERTGNAWAKNQDMAGNEMYEGPDYTPGVVNLINQHLSDLQELGVPANAAMPNWLSGGTPSGSGCGTHGCPIIPPIDVEDNCSSHPLSLPELSEEMQTRTGQNVTVFVLDALPEEQTVRDAAQQANATGIHNQLLQDLVARLDATPPTFVITYQDVGTVDDSDPEEPVTGKDIYGHLVGFTMPDHGLFIAGMIHDLAPGANIECIRVLNDYGVGDVSGLTDALSAIQQRMIGGTLSNRHVVINLSLVATPSDEELQMHPEWFDLEHIAELRQGMRDIIDSMEARGAVFVASAGNDSDTRDTGMGNGSSGMGMGMTANGPVRFGPRYPAAFPEVISVGAVDDAEKATTYSNKPGPNGVATYGGTIPTDVVQTNPRTIVADVHAPIGVYSSSIYPSLSVSDPLPRFYDAPADSYAWAYWVGTSFSTPIISALTARVLEHLDAMNWQPSTGPGSGPVDKQWATKVQWVITTPDGQSTILGDGISLPIDPDLGVSVLKASQEC